MQYEWDAEILGIRMFENKGAGWRQEADEATPAPTLYIMQRAGRDRHRGLNCIVVFNLWFDKKCGEIEECERRRYSTIGRKLFYL